MGAGSGLAGFAMALPELPWRFRLTNHSSKNAEPVLPGLAGFPLPEAGPFAAASLDAPSLPTKRELSPARKRANISCSTTPRGRPYLAADKRFRASASCGFDLPSGGTRDILKGAEGTLLIITDATLSKLG